LRFRNGSGSMAKTYGNRPRSHKRLADELWIPNLYHGIRACPAMASTATTNLCPLRDAHDAR
ncbi:MAG TPA: hypothetical protein VFQ01_01390, partial [Nocardioides sp.]|nr:hypothetical protein [Nocardioides sp.]